MKFKEYVECYDRAVAEFDVNDENVLNRFDAIEDMYVNILLWRARGVKDDDDVNDYVLKRITYPTFKCE